ncbi:folylpolyglutamate synthase/dihydrofolate synthase family protein [Salipiger sp. 1_MG-2023]|uniref:bifunctional folylpolyglutamate synthase/dihydrofolate synthase n=1 Tax=Salipiger sp. 1_MG-2023 TaxID=3062665 RepID=UPI0026E23D16|nr:folylpolyglutamate synthase/dihydrofolate synthase family protein [Salipiger sp. 1_MG-2023]MDO6584852.1 folylpolyglutamate synthase/dihydrofolate synthase family protein [Salipiger sp. 1_MG-2023]
MTQGSDAILARMMSLHPKIIDLTLDRVWRLLAALDHPERQMPPVIHAAGTNGKGSTLAMLRAGYDGAGKTVHAYTSPHLARFHERIRVAGKLIDEDALSAVLDECWQRNGGESITYFEITTCAAYLAFSRSAADVALIETGLGGRLDATNVFDAPALTVITPISLDHQQYLGETLAEIAGEKAGILKRGVPCVVGPQPEEAMQVIEARAARLGAPLLAHGQHWQVWEERGRLVFQDENGLLDLPLPNLPGAHQIENAGAALAALRHLGLGPEACEAAVTRADWPARMQRLTDGPLPALVPQAELWLDGGHNPAAGAALARHLGGLPKRPTHLICGMLNTKDIAGYLRPLAGHADRLTALSIPGEANTLPAGETARVAASVGMVSQVADSVEDALQRIASDTPEARILICGSLYLAGDVLRKQGG